MNSKWMHMVAFILLIVGGLNWGLVGIGLLMGSSWNIVHMLLSSLPMVEAIVYILVGLSALWIGIKHKSDCKSCMGGSM